MYLSGDLRYSIDSYWILAQVSGEFFLGPPSYQAATAGYATSDLRHDNYNQPPQYLQTPTHYTLPPSLIQPPGCVYPQPQRSIASPNRVFPQNQRTRHSFLKRLELCFCTSGRRGLTDRGKKIIILFCCCIFAVIVFFIDLFYFYY